MVATVIICIVIVVAGFFAGRQAILTFSGDGSCCGKKSAKKARRVRVTDTDEANYPYTTDVPVGGMTCEKCAGCCGKCAEQHRWRVGARQPCGKECPRAVQAAAWTWSARKTFCAMPATT